MLYIHLLEIKKILNIIMSGRVHAWHLLWGRSCTWHCEWNNFFSMGYSKFYAISPTCMVCTFACDGGIGFLTKECQLISIFPKCVLHWLRLATYMHNHTRWTFLACLSWSELSKTGGSNTVFKVRDPTSWNPGSRPVFNVITYAAFTSLLHHKNSLRFSSTFSVDMVYGFAWILIC